MEISKRIRIAIINRLQSAHEAPEVIILSKENLDTLKEEAKRLFNWETEDAEGICYFQGLKLIESETVGNEILVY